jgi:hypothetical protein
MKINRHPVNLEGMSEYFTEESAELDYFLAAARRSATNLDLLLSIARGVYLSGAIVAPDSPEVARALMLSAQAGTATFVFQRIDDPPWSFVLGEGPPVVYTKPAGSSGASIITWMDAFYFCLITRQAQLSDELCRVSNEVFRHSDLVGAATDDYGFADLLRAVWTQEHFTRDPAFIRLETECPRRAAKSKRKPSYLRLFTLPYLNALRQLERRDESGFATALTEGLRGHKEFWSSAQYREEFNGFVSLPFIAAAALAWDRGMRFEVESDYLPMSWVRGDLFRTN